MAVYKRSYKPYAGPLTSERWRFLVVPRHAFHEVFESRLLTGLLVLCLIPFLVETVAVYVTNFPAARAAFRIKALAPLDFMRPQFFLGALTVQGFLAFIMTALVAPILVSADLVNGALPLYLSRPFSRTEYVLGKATVLLILLSGITWVPVGTVFLIQASLATDGWLLANLRVGWAIFGGAWIWIVVVTLLGLAVSAWIRLRIVASGALFGVLVMGSAFGEAWREVLGNSWGRLGHLPYLIGIVWSDLFGAGPSEILALTSDGSTDLPVSAAWLALLAVSALSLWLLDQRLRAREVVA